MNSTLKDMLYSTIFTALICVLSPLSIPLIPPLAPITGQTLGVMLAGTILSTKQTALCIATYILLGAFGLPVFANGQSGLVTILGPWGGFLLGFLLGGMVISLLRGKNHNFSRTVISCILGGIVVVYLVGIPWMSLVTTGSLLSMPILTSCLFYLPGDIVKMLIASIVGVRVGKQLQKI